MLHYTAQGTPTSVDHVSAEEGINVQCTEYSMVASLKA